MNLISKLNEGMGAIEGSECVDDVYFKYNIRDRGKILLTFGPATPWRRPQYSKKDAADGSIIPWCFKLAKSNNINVISFQHLERNNYYRSSEFIQFMKELASLLSIFEERLAYGASHGGFAVGSFSGLLNIDRALLFNPVSTKNKKIAHWDDRASTEKAQDLDWDGEYNDVDMGRSRGHIFLDPRLKIDVLHAERFNLKVIKVHGFGHGPGVGFLSRLGVIKEVFFDFINDELSDGSQLKSKLKLIRFSSNYYKSLKRDNEGSPYRLAVLEKLQKQLKVIAEDHAAADEDLTDMLRDAAVELETKNIKMSYELMKKASSRRPNGLFILTKLKKYEDQLKKTLVKRKKFFFKIGKS
jgi:hypothetical protein